LRFAGGVTSGMVRARRRRDDLVLEVVEHGGSVTIKGWFATAAARIELVQFADGTTWDEGTVRKLVCESPGGHAGAPSLHAQESETLGSPGHEGVKRDDRREQGLHDDATIWRQAPPDFHFDFEAIVRALRQSDPIQPQPSREDIARQWDAVRRHASGLALESDDSVTFEGASGWWRAAASLLGMSGFGFEASIGAAHGPEALKPLGGLNEGFQRL
jgi:hypothetical protein